MLNLLGSHDTPRFITLARGDQSALRLATRHRTAATERFLAQAAKLIRFSDVQNAAAFFGVPPTTLARWYYAYAERLAQAAPADQALLPITHRGVDELSQKNGTGNSSSS